MQNLLQTLLMTAGMAVSMQIQALAQSAPTPLLTEDQVSNILKQLDQLEGQITQNKSESLSAALSACRIGMSGDKEALDLFLNCTKLENFDKRNLKQTDFQDWRDRNMDRLKEPEFLAALRLQLEYLALTIQAQSADTPEKMAPHVTSLMAFMPKVQSTVQSSMRYKASGQVEEKSQAKGGNAPRPRPGGQSSILSRLQENVTGNVIAKAYRLDEYLKKGDWAYSPGDFNAMYDKVIVPYYLNAKPDQVPAQLDSKINAELAMKRATLSEAEFLVFQKEQYPQLLWQKATFLWGKKIQPVQSLADMLRILRENPNHPSAGNWLSALKSAVEKQKSQTPAAVTSTSTAQTEAP